MSKPEVTPEIEDVLSSIRRLVSGQTPDGVDFPQADDGLYVGGAGDGHEDVRPSSIAPEKPLVDALVLSQAQRLPDAGGFLDDDEIEKTAPDVVEPELWKQVEATFSKENEPFFEPDDPSPVVSWGKSGPSDVDLSLEMVVPPFVRPQKTSKSPFDLPQQHPTSDEPEDILREELEAPMQSDEPWETTTDEAETSESLHDEIKTENHDADDTQEAEDEDPWTGQQEFDAPEDFILETVAEDVTKASVERIMQNRGDAGGDTSTPDEGVTFDREDLHGIVSEIIREELQGALGERITRNVRKLVRREVHRALTSRDFE